MNLVEAKEPQLVAIDTLQSPEVELAEVKISQVLERVLETEKVALGKNGVVGDHLLDLGVVAHVQTIVAQHAKAIESGVVVGLEPVEILHVDSVHRVEKKIVAQVISVEIRQVRATQANLVV